MGRSRRAKSKGSRFEREHMAKNDHSYKYQRITILHIYKVQRQTKPPYFEPYYVERSLTKLTVEQMYYLYSRIVDIISRVWMVSICTPMLAMPLIGT